MDAVAAAAEVVEDQAAGTQQSLEMPEEWCNAVPKGERKEFCATTPAGMGQVGSTLCPRMCADQQSER